MHSGHVLYNTALWYICTLDMYYITLHCDTHAPWTCIILHCTVIHMHPGHVLYYTALWYTCTRYMHHLLVFLATLIFSGVFYPCLCLYPSFCPCLCRVCLDACLCPFLSSVLYLCRGNLCLDVCLYAGVVLYPCLCLFPYSLSHLVMLTCHLFQPQFYPRFPFLSKFDSWWNEKRITKRSIWPPFPYIHCKLGEKGP